MNKREFTVWFVRNFVLRGEESSLGQTPMAVTVCAFREREKRGKRINEKKDHGREEMSSPAKLAKVKSSPMKA